MKRLEANLYGLSCIKKYLFEQANQFKEIVSKKIASSRMNLRENHLRSSETKGMIGVSPQPYLDHNSNPFDQHQWKYLSLRQQ